MRNRPTVDVWIALVLLACSIWVCLQSLDMGIGQASNPGPGLIFLVSAIALGALSVLLLFQGRTMQHPDVTAGRSDTSQVVKAFFLLVLYAMLFEDIGFLLTTAVMMTVMARLAGEKTWTRSITFATAATVGTYVVLEVWLQTRLPGVLEGLPVR